MRTAADALAPLDLAARPRADLLVGVLLARLPDHGPDRPARHSSRWRVPGGSASGVRGAKGAVVCPDPLLDLRQRRRVARGHSPRRHRLGVAGAQPRAAPLHRCRRPLLPLFHRLGAGLRQLPVGRDAFGSGIHFLLPRAAWPPPPPWRRRSALATRDLPAALGVVLHLLRVWGGEDLVRRSAVAGADGDGPLL